MIQDGIRPKRLESDFIDAASGYRFLYIFILWAESILHFILTAASMNEEARLRSFILVAATRARSILSLCLLGSPLIYIRRTCNRVIITHTLPPIIYINISIIEVSFHYDFNLKYANSYYYYWRRRQFSRWLSFRCVVVFSRLLRSLGRGIITADMHYGPTTRASRWVYFISMMFHCVSHFAAISGHMVSQYIILLWRANIFNISRRIIKFADECWSFEFLDMMLASLWSAIGIQLLIFGVECAPEVIDIIYSSARNDIRRRMIIISLAVDDDRWDITARDDIIWHMRVIVRPF